MNSSRVTFELERPTLYMVWLLFIYGLSFLFVIFSSLNLAVTIGVALVILIYSFIIIRRYYFIRMSSNVAQLALVNGRFFLQSADGTSTEAILLGDSVITIWLIVLRFRYVCTGKTINLVCFPRINHDVFRRLRVLLLTQH